LWADPAERIGNLSVSNKQGRAARRRHYADRGRRFPDSDSNAAMRLSAGRLRHRGNAVRKPVSTALKATVLRAPLLAHSRRMIFVALPFGSRGPHFRPSRLALAADPLVTFHFVHFAPRERTA
jgi:hypothetical protein